MGNWLRGALQWNMDPRRIDRMSLEIFISSTLQEHEPDANYLLKHHLEYPLFLHHHAIAPYSASWVMTSCFSIAAFAPAGSFMA